MKYGKLIVRKNLLAIIGIIAIGLIISYNIKEGFIGPVTATPQCPAGKTHSSAYNLCTDKPALTTSPATCQSRGFTNNGPLNCLNKQGMSTPRTCSSGYELKYNTAQTDAICVKGTNPTFSCPSGKRLFMGRICI